jgi:L-ascorbate metabolism protein UlaG (beta-lactamase superfamily)
LIDGAGHRVITDPLLTKRVAHLRRRRAAPDTDAADVDTVLVSHAHMDHLHLASLRKIRPGARVITPRGTGTLVRKAGFRDVVEVVAGQVVDDGPASIEVVPAMHGSGRGPHSRIHADPVGFVIGLGGRRIYYAGDTDLFPEMSELTDIDVALLPIWGWGPTIGAGHLDPSRAAQAAGLITPRVVVPIHWGTYAPENGRRRLPRWLHDPADRFVDALDEVGGERRLEMLDPGGRLELGTG